LVTFVATKVTRISWRSQRRNAFEVELEAANECKCPTGQSAGYIAPDVNVSVFKLDRISCPGFICGSEVGILAARRLLPIAG
jgi:hypothetical protein